MDEDTGNNSELEHADTQYGGQEGVCIICEPASHASQHASHASQQGSYASQHKITLFLT